MVNDISGNKFGLLTAIRRVPGSKWICSCECGNERVVSTGHLNAGYFKCCGCTVRHGMTRSREHNSYHNMLSRCSNKNNKRYHDYGGKGISVCDRWAKSFINFYKDMGDCPKGFQIDRIDNEKGYSPENCRWVSRKENQANRSTSKIYTLFGKDYLSTIDAAKSLGVSTSTICHWCGLRKKKDGSFYNSKKDCSYRMVYE